MPKTARFVCLLIAAALLGGCFHARTLSGTRHDLERAIPGSRFEPEFQITLGRASLGLARAIVRAAVDEEDVADAEGLAALQRIRRVELATYETRHLPELDGGVRFPGHRALTRKGWKVVVSAVSQGDATWVYLREDRSDRPRDLMVVALDDDELVMVKVRGDLQRMLDELLENEVVEVPGVVRADLEPADGEPIAVVEMED